MYRTTIVGHDLQEGGRDALALGQLVAGPSGGQRIAAAMEAVADEAGATAKVLPTVGPRRVAAQTSSTTLARHPLPVRSNSSRW